MTRKRREFDSEVGQARLMFLFGVLDVVRVGLAAFKEFLDIIWTSKPDRNSVVDVLNHE